MKSSILKKGWSVLLAAAVSLSVMATPLTALATADAPGGFALTEDQQEENKDQGTLTPADPSANAQGNLPDPDDAEEKDADKTTDAAKEASAEVKYVTDENGNIVYDEDGNPIEDVEIVYVDGPADPPKYGALMARTRAGGITNPEVSLQLKDWVVYDHYRDEARTFGYPNNTVNPPIVTGDSYLAGNYVDKATLDTFKVTYAYTGLEATHPYYYTAANSSDTPYWDLSDPNVIKAYEAAHLTSNPTVSGVSQHIYQQGSDDLTEYTFLGYYSWSMVDWALAPIQPEYETALKTVSFDINAGYVRLHTLNSFGLLMNAGVSGGKLNGYAMNVVLNVPSGGDREPAETGTIQLVDMTGTNAMDANLLHVGSKNNSTTNIIPKTTTSSNVVQLYTNAPGSTVANTPFNLNLTNSSTYNRTFKVTLEMLPTSIRIKVNYYTAEGKVELDANGKEVAYYLAPQGQSIEKGFPVNNSGFNSFGPFVGYSGNSHSCPNLSYVKFSRLKAVLGNSVYFYHNIPKSDGTFPDDEVFAKVTGLETGDTLQSVGQTLPTNLPTREGYVFVGWNTDREGQGTDFKVDTPLVDGLTEVYAQWEKVSVSAEYAPPEADGYTNKNVQPTVEVVSIEQPTSVVITYADKTTETVTTFTKDPFAHLYYYTPKDHDKNFTGATVTATVPDGLGGSSTVTCDYAVTWIDKLEPLVTVPADGTALASNSVTIVDQEATTDNAKSGIDNVKTTITLTPQGGGTPITGSTWAAVYGQLTTGVYDLTVDAWDIAGNNTQDKADGVYYQAPGAAIQISATYAPAQWVKQETPNTVTATVTIVSPAAPTKVMIGGVDYTSSVQQSTPAAGTYTVTYDFTANGTAKVEVETAIPGLVGTNDLNVTRFDKNVPEVTQLPTIGADRFMEYADTSDIIVADKDDNDALWNNAKASGVAKYELWLYKVEKDASGTLKVALTPEKLVLPIASDAAFKKIDAGLYYYDVVVVDNVGWEGKASDQYGGLQGSSKPDPQKPVVPGGGADPKNPPVIINAKNPTITLSPNPAGANAQGWYNKNVVVTGNAASGTADLASVTIEEKDGKITAHTGPASGQTDNSNNVTLNDDGEYQLSGKVVDEIGLDGSTQAPLVIRIDMTKPVIENMPADGATIDGDEPVAAKDPAKNNTASGIADEVYKAVSSDGKNTYTGTSWKDLYDKISVSGTYTITANATDNADNKAVEVSATVQVDKGGKVDWIQLAVAYNPDSQWVSGKVKVTVTVTSPVAITAIEIDGNSATVTAGAAGTYVGSYDMAVNKKPFTVTAETGNGSYNNKTDCAVTWIDLEAPTYGNFPNFTPQGNVASVDKMAAITITDQGSLNGTLGGKLSSGVEDASKELRLYKVDENSGKVSTTPIVIKWADLTSATWVKLDSGEYYYDVASNDIVKNASKASDAFNGLLGSKPDPSNPGPKPGEPVDPNVPPIVVNPTGPSIVEKGRTPDKTWVNINDGGKVTVDFEGKATSNIDTVVVTGSGYSETYTGTALQKIMNDDFDVTINGSYVMTITDKAGKTATATVEVKNIDNTAPEINDGAGLANGGDLGSVKLTDPTGAEKGTPSGVDYDNTTIVATSKNDGTVYSGKYNDVLGSLPSGDYDVQITLTDKAGNEVSSSATDMTYVSGDEKMVVRIVSYSPAESDGYTNQDVTVSYEVASPLAITNLEVNGVAITAATGSKAYQGTLILDHNDAIAISATTNNPKVKGSTNGIVTWIDKVKPVIKSWPTGTDVAGFVGVTFEDDASQTPQQAVSQIDVSKTVVSLVKSNGDVFMTATAASSDTKAEDVLARAMKYVSKNQKYRVFVYLEDNATNATDDSALSGNPADEVPGAGIEIGEVEGEKGASTTISLANEEVVLQNLRLNGSLTFGITSDVPVYVGITMNGSVMPKFPAGPTAVKASQGMGMSTYALKVNALNGFVKNATNTYVVTFYQDDALTTPVDGAKQYTFKVTK